MFLFKGDFWKHSTIIRGVRYITVSYYDGDKDVFQKIGELITDSFQSANIDETTRESLLDSDMAIEED